MTTYDRLEHVRSRYARLRSGWVPATARYQRRVRAALGPGYRVLDLGCGRGGIVERLYGGATWMGLDPDWCSLRRHRVPHLPRTCASAERLPFPAHSFDLVVASWVLEHLPAPDVTFAEVARVLRPGGRFLFLTPNVLHPLPRVSLAVARLHRVQSWLVERVYGRPPADTFPVAYRANSIHALGRLITDAGLRLVELDLIDDPAYLAWNNVSFVGTVALHAALPVTWNVHLVGEARKPCAPDVVQ